MERNLKTFIITTVAVSSMAVIGFATAPAGIAGGDPRARSPAPRETTCSVGLPTAM